MKLKMALWSLLLMATLLVIPGSYNELLAQRGQIQIGGPDGVVIGGGSGIRIGGANGVQFGAGRARFGPAGQGVQLGRGQGLRIGSFLLGGSQPPAKRMAYPNNALAPPVPYEPRTLVLPASAEGPIDYRLNGTPYRLKPGRKIQLAGNQRWTVEFSPADGLPEKAVSIEQPGRYVFRKPDQAWDLVREEPVVRTQQARQPVVPASGPITVDKARRQTIEPSDLVPPATAEPGQTGKRGSEELPAPTTGNRGRLKSVLERLNTGKQK
ncbi:MAG: hypothetical protein MK108_08465 [Mariniblastus sp.]|nr:hypothetical protein [Mariniblastus sp.]